jgi:hypothetical protein
MHLMPHRYDEQNKDKNAPFKNAEMAKEFTTNKNYN